MCLTNLIFGKWSKSKKITEQVQSSDLLGPLPGIKIYLIFEYPHFMLGFVLPNKNYQTSKTTRIFNLPRSEGKMHQTVETRGIQIKCRTNVNMKASKCGP